MDICHKPVMLNEVLNYLVPLKEDSLLIDSTMGEGGHSIEFLRRYPSLKVIGLDRDERIQCVAKERLADYSGRVSFYNTWFDDFYKNYPVQLERPDLILFDLGISVYHYEKSGRGFSFFSDEKLDMRLDSNQEISVFDIVNSYGCEELANVIYNYGEERLSRVIARAICEVRSEKQIESAVELAEIIKKCVPASYRNGCIHPATRTFQALRIEVNGELRRAKGAIEAAYSVLSEGGIMGIISFHSLEDRIVKEFVKSKIEKNVSIKNRYKVTEEEKVYCENLTKKPICATDAEIRVNAPSRSAKLRCIRKLKDE